MRRLALLLAVAATAALVPVPLEDAGAASVRARAMKQRLTTFSSCTRLVKYARRHTRLATRGGIAGPGDGGSRGGPVPPPTAAPDNNAGGGEGTGAPAPASPGDVRGDDSSGTNVQEAGVDEPDVVKSDGNRIFALSGTRVNAIDARAATPTLLGSLDLGTYGGEMLLEGKRLLVISYAPAPVDLPGPAGPEAQGAQSGGDAQVAPGEPSPGSPPYYDLYRPATLITEVDVSDPAQMKVVRTETVDGTFVDGRLSGATARLVISTSPAVFDYGTKSGLRTKARGWLPSRTVVNKRTGRKSTRLVGSCRAVRRPRLFSGLDTLTVLTIDMKKGLPEVDADGLMTDAQTVYGSDKGLFVATQRFLQQPSDFDQPPPSVTTAIHRFDTSDPGRTAYDASGEARGYVLNQFSLSEHEGVLRVATTDSPNWWPGGEREQSQSFVTTLKGSGKLLLPLGRVGGLGEGEQIYAVRFLGDAGYVVTFRQTDPLYTIDLSKPAEPRVAGELKILGYSAYLHPVGNGRLLGVGQDATEEGRRLGTQLSLFDVSDLSDPTRLSQRTIGSYSSSEVEYDHHAFLYWGPEKLAVLPVSLYDDNPFTGAIGFRVGSAKIEEVGRIEHDGGKYGTQVRRSIVIGKRLFTVSDFGAKSSSLSTLADEAWVPFPGAEYGYGGGVAPPPEEDGSQPQPQPARPR